MSSCQEPHFHHALKFREDICIGCSHCMGICPTEAIRVIQGKARLIENRCVDCGECYRVCPVGAIAVIQDDFENIYQYASRVALIPAIFTGQFPESATHGEIIAAVYALGFNEVIEVEESVPVLVEQLNKYLTQNGSTKPLISAFCPAIVRLIQVKFPTLTENIIRLKSPVDVTAILARERLIRQGVDPSNIGIFYVTPCAAKIVAVRSPVGEEKSLIDGVINMNYLYNRAYKVLRQKKELRPNIVPTHLPEGAICWSLTRGEASHMHQRRSLAIDEINNVVEFLDKVENDEVTGIDFLELRACDEGCAGGILCPGNRFLTADKLRKRARATLEIGPSNIQGKTNVIAELDHISQEKYALNPILPRSILKLDDDLADAMIKMKRIYELNKQLPQVDCGICGSPSCKALAEDIVQGGASMSQCIFIQKILEQNEKLEMSESMEIMRKIWGSTKLDKNSLKAEINDIS